MKLCETLTEIFASFLIDFIKKTLNEHNFRFCKISRFLLHKIMSSFIYLPTFIDNSFRFLTNLLLKSYKCFCSTNYVKDQFELNVDSFLFFVFLFLFSFHKEVL